MEETKCTMCGGEADWKGYCVKCGRMVEIYTHGYLRNKYYFQKFEQMDAIMAACISLGMIAQWERRLEDDQAFIQEVLENDLELRFAILGRDITSADVESIRGEVFRNDMARVAKATGLPQAEIDHWMLSFELCEVIPFAFPNPFHGVRGTV